MEYILYINCICVKFNLDVMCHMYKINFKEIMDTDYLFYSTYFFHIYCVTDILFM